MSGLSVTTRAYDTTTTALISGTPVATGVLSVDAGRIGVIGAATGTYDTARAGSGKTVTVTPGSLSLTGAGAGNYQLGTLTLTGAISPAVLTVTSDPLRPLSVTSKVYDGTTAATISGAGLLSGVLPGDSVTLGQAALSGTYATQHVGTGISVTVSGFSINNSDYQLAPVSLQGAITARPLTITGITVADKVYDGGLTATLTGASGQSLGTAATLSNVVAVDAGLVALANPSGLTASFTTKNVGDGKPVTVTSVLSLTGTAASDYSVSAPLLTGRITPAQLTIASGISALTRAYDGTTAVALAGTGVVSGGLVSSDSVAVDQSAMTGATADPHVSSSGKSVTISGIRLTGADAGNYQLTVSPVSVLITPRVLSLTGATASDKVYDGTVAATLNTQNLALSGVLAADSSSIRLGGSVSGAFDSADVGARLVTLSGYSLTGQQTLLPDYALPAGLQLAATITPKPLALSGLQVVSKTYDGLTGATLAGTVALSGVVTADAADVKLSGSPSAAFRQSDVGSSLPVDVTAPGLQGARAGNYSLPNLVLTGSITPAQLQVINLSAASRTYDATTAATLVGTPLLRGVIGADDVALDSTAMSGAFASAAAGTAQRVVVSGLSLTGSKAFDYTLTAPSLTADIARLVIQVAGLTVADKTYDGTAAASVSGTAGLAGVLSADSGLVRLAGSITGTFADANAGANKPVSLPGLRLDGAAAGNYLLTSPLTATINRLNLTVGSLSVSDKVYDGTTFATLTGTGSLNGVLRVDQAAVSLSQTGATAAFADADAGRAKPVTVSGLALSGASAGNYNIIAPSLSATISAATLVLGGLSADSRAYDGTSLATLSGVPTVSGVVAADLGRIVFDTRGLIGRFSDPNAGSGKTVTISGFAFTGVAAADYVVTAPSLVADISKAVLTVDGVSVATKVYDGTQAARLDTSGLTVRGVVASDTGRVGIDLGSAVATYASADVNQSVGGVVPVSVTNAQLTGSARANYQIGAISLGGVITPRTVTANGLVALSRAYDGTRVATVTVDPSVGAAGLDGVLATDLRAVGLAVASGGPTGLFATPHAGTGISVTVGGLSLSGSKAMDYSLAGLTLYADITRAIVTATGFSIAPRVYDTTTTATLVTSGEPGLSGVVAGDQLALTGTPSASYADAHASAAKSATVLGLSITGPSVADYQLAPLVLTGVVTPATLAVGGLSAQSRVYDGSLTAALSGAASVTGLYASDRARVQLSGLAVGQFADRHAGLGKAVTISGLTLTGASAGDYALSYPALFADVTPASIRVTGLTAASKVYDGLTSASLSGTAALRGVVTADVGQLQLSGVPDAQFSTADTGTGKSVAVAGLSLTGLASGDYSLVPLSLSASITPATLTYVADPARRSFGAANPVFTGTVTGLVNGETLAGATTGALSFASEAGPASGIGQFAITGGGLTAVNDNYQFVQADGNATALTVYPPFNAVTIGLTTSLTPVAAPGSPSSTGTGTGPGSVVDLQGATAPTGARRAVPLVCSETGGLGAVCTGSAGGGR